MVHINHGCGMPISLPQSVCLSIFPSVDQFVRPLFPPLLMSFLPDFSGHSKQGQALYQDDSEHSVLMR